MCCAPFEEYKTKDIKDHCPDCDTPVDENGDSLEGCEYSPIECETCGWCPCDNSC